MSTVDLMILGHLMSGPKNAYEMKREFEAQNINQWVKISMPSVYKNLLKLHEAGLLDAQVVREGQMPEKTVYTLNEKGLKYFFELMESKSNNVDNIYFEFSALVANLGKIDMSKGRRLIKNLQEQFLMKKNDLEIFLDNNRHIPPLGLMIIKLYKDLFHLFYDWSLELEKEYLDNHTS